MIKKEVYISKYAYKETIDYIKSKDYEIKEIFNPGLVGAEICHHPDIFMCKSGVKPYHDIFHGSKNSLGLKYPKDAIYNGCSTGKFFIHNLKITHPNLLSFVMERDIKPVHVSQGYARCNTLPVNETSIITSDVGIYKACNKIGGIHVLLISTGDVILPDFPYGFIGGTAGTIGNEMVFNGDLSKHKDFEIIVDFLEERSIKPIWFENLPLKDIGSIIEFNSEQ